MTQMRRMTPLLDVIGAAAIAAALISTVHPVLLHATERDKQTACISNLKRIGVAVAMYADDYADVIYPQVYSEYWGMPAGVAPPSSSAFPDPKLWATAYLPYTRSADVFRCPYDGDRLKHTNIGDISFRFGPTVPPATPESAMRVSYAYVGLDIWNASGAANTRDPVMAFRYIRHLRHSAYPMATPSGMVGWIARDKDFTVTVNGTQRLATAHSVSPNGMTGSTGLVGVLSNVLFPDGSVKTLKDWEG
ncbi:MAG TPA: hypothetical protein VGM37_03515 [Armatimonadota bacterium]